MFEKSTLDYDAAFIDQQLHINVANHSLVLCETVGTL